ncbi:hypothetical protein BGY98DRAFT_1189758 [Russula aff. rugulosa BPL654]|nr:hypothetical protein BGY98DRAFT_1189758 [Russula aff. rugulosa BPL654]
MVVFTFVNNGHAGGYFISGGGAAMGWRGLPHDLDREMEDVRRKGEEVEEVSLGLDGDWFLRTNTRHACKTDHGRPDMVSNVEQFVQLLQQANLSLADYAIQFFTFVPDPTGYVTVLHKTDDTLTRCAWHNVPRELDMVLEREGPKGVRHVTVGVNGSYVVILNSGAVLWGAGVPARLHQILEDARRRGRPVAAVSLSLASPSWYFVQFADGATDFSLPSDWHQSINIYTAQAVQNNSRPFRMTTAYNHETPFRSQTFPQYTPQPPQGQTGSFSPGGLIPSYGGGPNPGYKLPFQSNPYPPPAYPAMPVMPQLPVMPQQPVYNVTNVYNTVSEQLQQQGQPSPSGLAKYNGMFTLLGGALKLAGTVLGPTLQNDWSNFNSN